MVPKIRAYTLEQSGRHHEDKKTRSNMFTGGLSDSGAVPEHHILDQGCKAKEQRIK